MSDFRHFKDEDLDDFSIRQISNDGRNPIKKLLLDFVHADLDIMEKDARKMRNGKPFIFTNLFTLKGLEDVIGWIKKYALLEEIEEPNLIR